MLAVEWARHITFRDVASSVVDIVERDAIAWRAAERQPKTDAASLHRRSCDAHTKSMSVEPERQRTFAPAELQRQCTCGAAAAPLEARMRS